MSNVHDIDLKGDRVNHVNECIEHAVANLRADFGDELAGYALVGWDMGGRCFSGYLTDYGLVKRGLMPTLVQDALQRHVIVDMISEGAESTRTPPTA